MNSLNLNITPTTTEQHITQEAFHFGKDYWNCYCEFWDF
jgi:hypothetical protein